MYLRIYRYLCIRIPLEEKLESIGIFSLVRVENPVALDPLPSGWRIFRGVMVRESVPGPVPGLHQVFPHAVRQSIVRSEFGKIPSEGEDYFLSIGTRYHLLR